MKKKYLLLLGILFLTGCNAEYNIDLSKDYINENITLFSENSLDNKEIEEFITSFNNANIFSDSKLENVEYYNSYKNLDKNNYELNFNYNLKNTQLNSSPFINNSFENHNISFDDNILNFDFVGLKVFKEYDNLTNLTIKLNISSDYEIINANTNNIDNNLITWNISKDDSDKFLISFSLRDVNYPTENLPTTDNSNLEDNNKEEMKIKDEEIKIEDEEIQETFNTNNGGEISAIILIVIFLLVAIIFIALKNIFIRRN